MFIQKWNFHIENPHSLKSIMPYSFKEQSHILRLILTITLFLELVKLSLESGVLGAANNENDVCEHCPHSKSEKISRYSHVIVNVTSFRWDDWLTSAQTESSSVASKNN